MKFSAQKTAFVFPGQGSQKVGMGKYLAETYPEAKQVFEEVDDAIGKNLSQIIFEGPEEDLNMTENTQPAIMATSMAVWKVLEKQGPIEAQALLVAGHSLGEYAALCAAGAFSITDAALLLDIRGRAMQQAVPFGEGLMAAIIGPDFADVKAAADEAGCEVANDNSPGQVVISGKKEAVLKAMEIAKEKGAKKAVELAVSAPFHCSLMQPAAEVMQEALEKITILEPKIPVICNVTAEATQDVEVIRQNLVSQVCGTVRWRESVKKMEKLGVQSQIEIGNGKVLSGLVKRISGDIKPVTIGAPNEINDYIGA